MKKYIKQLALALALVMTAFTLAACSSGGSTDAAATSGTDSAANSGSVSVYLCGAYVDDAATKEYTSTLQGWLDAVTGGGVTVNVTGISTGSDADPTMQMAAMTQSTLAVASGEIDIMIADETNAARNARGETFYLLSDILTDSEISALDGRTLAYDMVDDNGNSTGESTGVCGVDVTRDASLKNVFGDTQLGMFIVGNAPNLENAKTLFNAIIANLSTGDEGAVVDNGDEAAQDAAAAAAGTDEDSGTAPAEN